MISQSNTNLFIIIVSIFLVCFSGRKKVWTDIIDEVAKSKSHLKMLQSSPAMQSMKHNDNGRVQHYADQLDLSKSEKYKVRSNS